MKKKLLVVSLLVIVGSLVAFAVVYQTQLNCFKCKGTGSIDVKVTCPICNGNKYDSWGDKCYRCDGNGYIYESIECPECGGTGEQTKSVPFPEPERRY